MNKLTTLLLLTACLISGLSAQIPNPKHPDLLSPITFGIDDSNQQGIRNSDTVWLPTREDTYHWDGKQLGHSGTKLAWYNSRYELSQLIQIIQPDNDSLIKINYIYDNDSRLREELRRNYKPSDSTWEIDFKAKLFYNELGLVDTTLIQAWDTQNEKWKDSIAQILVWNDSIEITKYTIERIVDDVWTGAYGFAKEYHYTADNHIDEEIQYKLNTQSQTWENEFYATYMLNDDGTWYESIWYTWDDINKDWRNQTKYTITEWIVFNGYPFYPTNLASDRTFYWWTGDEWYAYLKDSTEMISYEREDKDYWSYDWDNSTEDWYLSSVITMRNYPNKLKRRYTNRYRNGINQPWILRYDDSVTWKYFHSNYNEMYRQIYDTTIENWRPEAKLVYSDYIYYVNIEDISENAEKLDTLKIIPNPADDIIEIENHHQFTAVSLFNMKGKLIERRENLLNTTRISMDIKNLPPGTYLLQAHTHQNKIVSGKLIVK